MGSDHSVKPRATAEVGSPLHPDRLDDRLAIDGMGDGAPHAHIGEGGLIGPHLDRLASVGQQILVAQVGMALLERVQVLLGERST